MEPAPAIIVRGIGRNQAMRIYISDECSEKLERVAERKGDSPENTLQEAIDDLAEKEAHTPSEGGAGSVEKSD